jgi:protein phosphatase 1 regulatory subunit 7
MADPNPSPLRGTKSGWDGKLRMSDINGQDKDDSDSDASTTASQEEARKEQAALVAAGPPPNAHLIPHPAPMNQPGVRRALMQQGPPVPGDEIDADEDLLAEYDPDTEEIDLIHLRISKIKKLGLDRFKKLQRLCLRQNAIEVIDLPDELASTLTEIDLYDNLLKRVEGLHKFTGLTNLDLSFNKIKHIKNVNQCVDLKDLYFVQNRISQIENLEGMTKLRNLELGGNRIREIEGLDTLTGLEELWLGKNKITEIKVHILLNACEVCTNLDRISTH